MSATWSGALRKTPSQAKTSRAVTAHILLAAKRCRRAPTQEGSATAARASGAAAFGAMFHLETLCLFRQLSSIEKPHTKRIKTGVGDRLDAGPSQAAGPRPIGTPHWLATCTSHAACESVLSGSRWCSVVVGGWTDRDCGGLQPMYFAERKEIIEKKRKPSEAIRKCVRRRKERSNLKPTIATINLKLQVRASRNCN